MHLAIRKLFALSDFPFHSPSSLKKFHSIHREARASESYSAAEADCLGLGNAAWDRELFSGTDVENLVPAGDSSTSWGVFEVPMFSSTERTFAEGAVDRRYRRSPILSSEKHVTVRVFKVDPQCNMHGNQQ